MTRGSLKTGATRPASPATNAAGISADVAARFASVHRLREDLASLEQDLEGMLVGALADADHQQAIASLVDSLTAATRRLTPEETLVCDGLVGVKDAAAFLGIGVKLTRNLVARGELRQVRIGERRLIPKRLLIRFAAERLDQVRDHGGTR